jgi:hypothetical protein
MFARSASVLTQDFDGIREFYVPILENLRMPAQNSWVKVAVIPCSKGKQTAPDPIRFFVLRGHAKRDDEGQVTEISGLPLFAENTEKVRG